MGNGQDTMSRVPDIVQHRPLRLWHHLLSKAISEVQHSGETGKEIQVNFPTIEESGPRENDSGRAEAPQQLFQIPPFFAAIFRTRLARRRHAADELELLKPLARTQTENFWTFCHLLQIFKFVSTQRKNRKRCSSWFSFGPLSISIPCVDLTWNPSFPSSQFHSM